MSNFLSYYESEIEKNGGLRIYVSKKAREKRPLLKKVIKFSKARKKVIEAGCGSAVNSIYLAHLGLSVTSIDNNEEILMFANKNASFFEKKPKIVKGDIFSMAYKKNNFDVAFSHGVLEHFSEEEIIKIINSELRIAKYVVFSVPSNFFKKEEAINGDERFLSVSEWKGLIKKSNGLLIEEFSYFYDSDSFKIKFFKLLDKISLGKFPRKKPYIGFVVKNG